MTQDTFENIQHFHKVMHQIKKLLGFQKLNKFLESSVYM